MYKFAGFVFVFLLAIIGFCQAQHVETWEVWYFQFDQPQFVGTASDSNGFDLILKRLNRAEISADSVRILYTQKYLHPDSCAIVLRNYDTMAFSYDTLGVEWFDVDLWKTIMGSVDYFYMPIAW